MAKGIKLSEFKKSEITALKRVENSRREVSTALGRSKTVICYYLKSQNKYGTRKPTDWLEKLSSQFKRRIVQEVKEENFVNIKYIEISRGCSLHY